MNRWYFPAFACFYFATLTPLFLVYSFGWNITPLELPYELYIIDVLSFVLGNIGASIFGIMAITKDRH